MESISVKGPGGYTYDIGLERYTTKNLNGYLGPGNRIWFMGYDRRGFLKDGRYDITLTYKSGRITRKGRVLKYSGEILDSNDFNKINVAIFCKYHYLFTSRE